MVGRGVGVGEKRSLRRFKGRGDVERGEKYAFE